MESWVNLRAKCSPYEVFVQLRSEVEKDVEYRKALLKPGEADFTVKRSHNSFAVIRQRHHICASVVFEWSVEFGWNEHGILVRDELGKTIADGTVALNDGAECVLRVDDQEFQFWEFRKKVLQDLFFKF